MTKPNPFEWSRTSSEIIRLAVMLYVRFPLSLRNVDDLLHESGIEHQPRNLLAQMRAEVCL